MYSSYPSGRPAMARPKGVAAQPPAAPLPRWGWLEWFLVLEIAVSVPLFVPGVSALRVFSRVAAFVLALVAWFWIWRGGRKRPGSDSFPALPWLTACIFWLLLSIFHPNTNSLLSAVAQAAMYITILSPAFWAPSALVSSRQISRLMVVLFACNALSALVGLGQVYRPEIFNPPVIPALEGPDRDSKIDTMSFQTASGQRIIRPCGLTDNPGAAAGAGVIACILGLCLALRPIEFWKRMASLGMALVGMAVVYYCQVRTAMVMILFSVFGLIGLFVARKNYRQATLLGVGTAAIVLVAAAWVVSTVGDVGVKRFFTLFQERPEELYYKSRGSFVEQTFSSLIWEAPLGGGMGRYGQAYKYFGDFSVPATASNGPTWVEVQWPGWVVDGGIPLMVLYATAIALAIFDSIRIALTSKDRELAYWAAVICALNVTMASLCFSSCPFIAPTGLNFWLLSAALHAADRRSRPAVPRGRPVRRVA